MKAAEKKAEQESVIGRKAEVFVMDLFLLRDNAEYFFILLHTVQRG